MACAALALSAWPQSNFSNPHQYSSKAGANHNSFILYQSRPQDGRKLLSVARTQLLQTELQMARYAGEAKL